MSVSPVANLSLKKRSYKAKSSTVRLRVKQDDFKSDHFKTVTDPCYLFFMVTGSYGVGLQVDYSNNQIPLIQNWFDNCHPD